MTTLGADVEIFLSQNGNPTPAIGLLKGSKTKPLPVNHGNLQEDNVMAEFAIDPAESKDQWVRHLNAVFHELMNTVGDQYEPMILPSCQFPDEMLTHPKAREFGCDPDINAYTLDMGAYSPDQVGNLRTCGGHIHVGESMTDDQIIDTVRAMDMFLGVPSVLADEDDNRRRFYGQAGSFRVKDYGLEYRSLSNFWIRTDGLMEWAYDAAIQAVQFIKNGNQVPEEVQNIINNSDRDGARRFIREHNLKEAA